MKKMNKKGFTIVELVIVIAVIAILAAVMIPTFSGIIEKANASAAQQKAGAIYKEIYAIDLSDGHFDGKEFTTTINTAAYAETGETVTYTVNADTETFVRFEFVGTQFTAPFTEANGWVTTKN